MKNYYRIYLGKGNKYLEDAIQGNFIGGDFDIDVDLTGKLPENWKDFNQKFIPYLLEKDPERSKISAGLACGMLHTIAKGMKVGDIVLSFDGEGNYYVGEIKSEYRYLAQAILPHRRDVMWFDSKISKTDMSQPLQNSIGSVGTVSNISKYKDELEELLEGHSPSKIIINDETIENPIIFALEKHLEDFLVSNWSGTELGKNYDIYSEEGEVVGQQFPSDTGLIDILAVSKDKKEILVVELKKGRASDSVVGQIQRYMGYVKEELAEEGQEVKGVIIALEEDLKINRALSMTNNIEFYTYKLDFKLEKKSE